MLNNDTFEMEHVGEIIYFHVDSYYTDTASCDYWYALRNEYIYDVSGYLVDEQGNKISDACLTCDGELEIVERISARIRGEFENV